ncbi:MAG: hypothetical protein ABI779_27165 [Acidobacteriota bacterium]
MFVSGLATAAPAIEVIPAGLRATGLTRGGETIWFGASIDTFAMTPRLKRHVAAVSDTDRDGQTDYEIANLSRFTFIVAVDAATGEYALYKGQGVDGVEIDLRGGRWQAGLDQVDIPADFLEILLVRPGAGAWTASAIDGGKQDGDEQRNSKFRLKVKDMTPVSGSGRPQGAVRRGDLLVVVDPFSLKYLIRPAGD